MCSMASSGTDALRRYEDDAACLVHVYAGTCFLAGEILMKASRGPSVLGLVQPKFNIKLTSPSVYGSGRTEPFRPFSYP
jgi:hypothetical protein